MRNQTSLIYNSIYIILKICIIVITKILSPTVFNCDKRNVSQLANQNIRMISEGSSDNQDCNVAKNSPLP